MTIVDHAGAVTVRNRYHLLSWRSSFAKELGSRGAEVCMTPSAGSVTVRWDGNGRTTASGVRRCASPWACPVCAPVVRERRAAEVEEAVSAWRAKGGEVWLVTVTVPHEPSESLAAVMDRCNGWWRSIWSGSGGKALRRDLGMVGMVRAWDITVGPRSGWHPHIHALVFARRGEFSGRALVQAWRNQFGGGGYGERFVPRVSVDFRLCRQSAVAGYLAKVAGGWGVGRELASAGKAGSAGRRSAPQLLGDAAGGDAYSWALWVEYERTVYGRHFMAWTRGLRKLLGVGDIATDADAADDSDRSFVASCTVPATVWWSARSRGLLGHLLRDLVAGRWERWCGAPEVYPLTG